MDALKKARDKLLIIAVKYADCVKHDKGVAETKEELSAAAIEYDAAAYPESG